MKQFFALTAGLLLAAAVTCTSFADTQYLGDGQYVYTDSDGSQVYWNENTGGSMYIDNDGYALFDGDGNLTDFDLFSSSYSSSGSSSGSNRQYAGSEITNAYWSGTTAHWSADYRSKATFTVTLYCDDRKVSTKTSKGGSSVNLGQAIRDYGRDGYFYFSVKAKWPGGYTDENSSESRYFDSSSVQGSSSSSSQTISAAGPTTQTGWVQSNGVWMYRMPDGSWAANEWMLINNKWYYFDVNGQMQANQWIRNATRPDTWYYVGENGDMLTNQYVGQYYVDANGEWHE